jgi:UDP-glucose 4-epimerase
MSSSKNVLVLGGNGFIGSHLVDALAAQDFNVVVFDHFSAPPQFNESSKIKTIKGDILDQAGLSAALEGIDYLVHAFSATTPYTADLDPYADIEKNLLASARIFELGAQKGVKKVVYISSGGAIYGASAENGKSAKETDIALPISPYGICKLATERYLEYFEKKSGLQHVSYRLSNPYGPRQVTKNNQGVIPRFIENISHDQPISLYGDASSSRDYIYIEDAVNLIAKTFESATQRVYNIGAGEQTSLKDLIAALEELLGKRANVTTQPEPKSFVHTTRLDISRFVSEFNLKPQISLKEGLAKTIQSS